MRALLLCVLTAAALAQDATPDEQLAAKLASPFLRQAPWLTDWDQALAAAKAQQRLLFGYFTTAAY